MAERAAVEAADAALMTTLLRKGEEMKLPPVVAFATVAAVAFGAAMLTTRWPTHRGRTH